MCSKVFEGLCGERGKDLLPASWWQCAWRELGQRSEKEADGFGGSSNNRDTMRKTC